MRIKDLQKASLADIFKAFWQGMKPQIWGFYTSTFAFVASSVFTMLAPLYYKRFFDVIATASDRFAAGPELVHWLVIILILNGCGWFFFRLGLWSVNHFESDTMSRLRQISFDYLLGHSYAFFSDNFSGALVQRVNRFSRAFEKLYDSLVFNILPLLINIVGAIIVVWLEQPFIAGAMVVWVSITMIGNYFFSQWKIKYDVASAAADSNTTAFLADSISNQNAIASFTGAAFEGKGFKEVTEKQARASWLSWDISAIFDGFQAALITGVEFFLFYYGVKFWEQNVITIGTFVLIQVYLLGVAQQLWNFSRVLRNLSEGVADAEEMVSILKLEHEVKDAPGAKALDVKEGAMTFKKLSFAFGSNPAVLKDIDLSIKGGEKVAIIGPSGAGKSTLVRLILRMYNLPDDKILIDGQDIQKVTQESLRDAVSVVPQDPVLFHRSLMENIRYGRRDATDAEVIHAAKLAHCDDFIDALPKKYETYVGERGVKLSGGERQRVAIARAILKNASILILDEATSSLDSHSEALIQDALDKLMKGKTAVVIAHRLSTIRKMDRIVVVENGKIVEEGAHPDLIAKEGSLYKHLWDIQAGGFIKV